MKNKEEFLKIENMIVKMKDLILGLEDEVENIYLFNRYYWVVIMFLVLFKVVEIYYLAKEVKIFVLIEVKF